MARAPRMAAGAAVLLILVVFCAVLVPPYARNWELQNYVAKLADDPATAQRPEQAVREQIVGKAEDLGLPVSDDDVHVAKSDGGIKIDVVYIVQKNVAGYAVDLHFRPQAGG